MKVKYIGESFGVDGLTDGNVYSVLSVEYGNLRVVDDSGEDYLYSSRAPGPADDQNIRGRWEIIEDDAENTLRKSIPQMKQTA